MATMTSRSTEVAALVDPLPRWERPTRTVALRSREWYVSFSATVILERWPTETVHVPCATDA